MPYICYRTQSAASNQLILNFWGLNLGSDIGVEPIRVKAFWLYTGTALRSLIDHLLGQLQAQVPRPQHLPKPGWKGVAASAAAVMNEAIFGASPAWQAPGLDPKLDSSPSMPVDLEPLLLMVLGEYVSEPLWGLPTAPDPTPRWGAVGKAPPPPPQTLQALGENALLLQVGIDDRASTKVCEKFEKLRIATPNRMQSCINFVM